jgi:molybdenum cofactor synthesis domain-containing protein
MTETLTKKIKKIALLATGDELTNGDILNTNGQRIAQLLKDNGLVVGTHVIVADDEHDIESAINFLFSEHSEHDVLIVTGGLGPTSDDRTRFAVSKALQKPLVFHQASWDHIVARLTGFQLAVHESNRQQALFPESAEIIVNTNGTANGCLISEGKKIIVMLPGPPNECLTMFENIVLPKLLANSTQVPFINLKWRLFGISEGEIAAKLDQLLANYPLNTGYRWDYPYLEFKIRTQQTNLIPELNTLITETIAPYTISPGDKTAVQVLKEIIIRYPHHIIINDHATKGLLQFTLTTTATNQNLHFEIAKPLQLTDQIYIEVSGLDALWQVNNALTTTRLDIKCQHSIREANYQAEVPLRNPKVNYYAVELICYYIAKFMSELES